MGDRQSDIECPNIQKVTEPNELGTANRCSDNWCDPKNSAGLKQLDALGLEQSGACAVTLNKWRTCVWNSFICKIDPEEDILLDEELFFFVVTSIAKAWQYHRTSRFFIELVAHLLYEFFYFLIPLRCFNRL